MNLEPIHQSRVSSFADAINAAPRVAASNTFKAALFGPDGTQLGFMGEDSAGWAVLVAEANKAVTLESYPYDGITYYRNVATGKYLSVSNQAYVGFYGWAGATGWVLSGKKLISQFNQQALSLYSKDNAYLYAWDKYTVLTIDFRG